jgi:hypothetical protein
VFFDRSLDCVERDGTDDEKGHRGRKLEIRGQRRANEAKHE